MKNKKLLLVAPLLVGALALTSCGHGSSITPEQAEHAAQAIASKQNDQTFHDNTKSLVIDMTTTMNISMPAGYQSTEAKVLLELDVDNLYSHVLSETTVDNNGEALVNGVETWGYFDVDKVVYANKTVTNSIVDKSFNVVEVSGLEETKNELSTALEEPLQMLKQLTTSFLNGIDFQDSELNISASKEVGSVDLEASFSSKGEGHLYIYGETYASAEQASASADAGIEFEDNLLSTMYLNFKANTPAGSVKLYTDLSVKYNGGASLEKPNFIK